ncbi:MAG: hypothetical protein KBD66_00755 [Candidatus Doudnabacteria bacterium]|nr:hypothetical protein [Candidatus Doudnabacteria bacterium]
MHKSYKIIILCAIFVGIIGLFVSRELRAPSQETLGNFFEQLVAKLPEQQFYDTPLQKHDSTSNMSDTLSASGVIHLTNEERTKMGLATLTENALLKKAARAKLHDILEKQYFDHVSPDGKAPADVVEAAGYTYVLVGENLAEGDFTNDADLVTGWMNSPGHRKNILHPKYTEIGVAVERGTYKGRMVWVAVQEFGKPLTDCPQPSEATKTTITNNENQINIWQAELENLSASMEEQRRAGETEEHNRSVQTYNALVEKVNTLASQTKSLVAMYNVEVKQFNACIE